MEMNIRKNRGLTLIGFVIVLAVVLFFAYAGMRVIPMYLEYQALISRGVVGQDRRLEWIETVESLSRKHGLFSLNYTLGGQTLFQDPAADEVRAGFDAFESPLALEMAVLHEDQLLAFLRELRSQIHGLTILERCSVERIGSGRELRFGPQLKATCAVRLINLREKKKGA